MFENAEIISRYTRADAIRDGVLIDVSAVAGDSPCYCWTPAYQSRSISR